MKLVNPYHWLYVKIYLQQRRFNATNIDFTVILIMGVMLYMNAVVITSILDIFFATSFLGWIMDLSSNEILIGGILWVALNFLYFDYKERSEKILLEFDVESRLKKPYCGMAALVYEIFSVFSMIFTLTH